MTRLFALALTVLTAPAAVAQPAACPQFFLGGEPPALLNLRLAQRTTMLCDDAYAALASGVTRGPIWSAERLTKASLVGARSIPRQGAFHADDRLPRADQAQLADFARSGYDRGHMVPARDAPTLQAQAQTFSLANIVPQTAALNRGVWEGIESALRHLATRQGELYVVTGPAFQGQQVRSIGPNGVLVPSSTWKAVYDPRASGAGAYLCSNVAAPSCKVVSVATLTSITGVDPFPAVPDSVKQAATALPSPEHSPYARGHSQRQGRR